LIKFNTSLIVATKRRNFFGSEGIGNDWF